MATEYNIFGWEIGDMAEIVANTNYNIGMTVPNDGTARSGSFYQKMVMQGGTGSIMTFPAGTITGTTGTVTSGNHKRVRARVFFRIDVAFSMTFATTTYCIFGLGDDAGAGGNAAFPHVWIDSARQLALGFGNVAPATGGGGFTGTHTAPLVVGTWYSLTLDLDIAVSSASVLTASCRVTTDGASPAIDTTLNANVTLGAVDIVGRVSLCSVIAGSSIGSGGTLSFDDLCWAAASDSDAVSALTLPVDNKVLKLAPTGIGSAGGWSGAATDVDEYPVSTSGGAGDNISSSGAAGDEIAFTHASSSSLSLKGIAALKVYANIVVGSGTGNVQLKVNGLLKTVTPNTNYPGTVSVSPTTNWGPVFWGRMYPGAFDAVTFGVVKQNASQLTRIGNIVVEYITQTLPTSQIRGTTQIKDNTIIDAEINTAAGIKLTKLEALPVAPGDTASRTPAKGDVLVSDGTTWKRKAVGADGKALLADSTKSDGLDWGTVATSSGGGTTIQGGSMVFVSEIAIVSGVAQVDIALPNTYDEFELEFLDVLPATSAASIQMRISTDNGATYDSGSNYKTSLYQTSEGATSGALNAGTTAHWIISSSLSNTAAAGGASGRFTLINASGANHKRAISHVEVLASDGNTYSQVAGHRWMATGVVTNLRVFLSSGNFTSGKIRLFGIAGGITAPNVGSPRIVGEVPVGALNGSNTVYTTATRYTNLCVYVNGVRQKKTTHYSETSATTFTMVTAPLSTDVLTVDYGDGPTVSQGGSLVFLQEQIAAASATLDITSAITAAYDEYIVELINLLPATASSDIQMQVSSNNGSTWSSAGCTYSIIFHGVADSAAGFISNSNAAQFPLATGIVNSGAGVSGTINFFDPLNATLDKELRYDTALKQPTPKYYQFRGSGWYTGGLINALRFKASSGNITSGAVRIYGVAKTALPAGLPPTLTPPNDAIFSWVNQGSAVLTVTPNSISIADVMAASDNTRVRVKPALTPPYTVTIYMLPTFIPRQFVGPVVVFRDSVSGKMARFACYCTSSTGGALQTGADKLNSPTSFNASYNVDIPVSDIINWWRLKDDGTNRSFHISRDGINWIQIHSVGRTDFLTADQVGWGMQNFNNAGGSNYTTYVNLMSWKETQP